MQYTQWKCNGTLGGEDAIIAESRRKKTHTNNKRPRKRFTNCKCVRTLYSMRSGRRTHTVRMLGRKSQPKNFLFSIILFKRDPKRTFQYRERECALHHSSISVYPYILHVLEHLFSNTARFEPFIYLLHVFRLRIVARIFAIWTNFIGSLYPVCKRAHTRWARTLTLLLLVLILLRTPVKVHRSPPVAFAQ